MGRNPRFWALGCPVMYILSIYCPEMLCPHYNPCYLCPDDTIQPKTPCERARDAAINGPIGAYIPTCDAAGQYTPKQCSGSTGYCWCVTSTGQKIPGTETPPGTAPIKCPCSGPRR
uniref:Thyroglobulin type-1 domain-containing protein n=1 Tax=Oncorhynchus kisutch TaxID=8019 RepID=A0A8C7MMI2_ONCKI